MTSQSIETGQPFPPEAPPEFPFTSPNEIEPMTIPMPIVYERESAGRMEYRVLALSSTSAGELEAKLNAESRDGWRLNQIISHEHQLLLVFMR